MGEEGDGRPDMVNRDPNALNDNLMVRFEDVIGEPDGAHTPDCAYKCGFNCYENCLSCCYKLLAFFCTWILGTCWGCLYACATFEQIWVISPCSKFCTIWINCFRGYMTLCYDCVLAPYCAACGHFFANIKVVQSTA